MLIEFAVDGGLAYIPALAAPVTIDTGSLEPDQARELEQLVNRAGFFGLPQTIGQLAEGAADHQTYTISIQDGDRSHSVRVIGLAGRPEVAALVRSLQQHVKELRRARPDGN